MGILSNAIQLLGLRQTANSEEVVIANAAAVSGSFDVNAQGGRGFAVEVPVAWTAADIAFEVSDDDSTYVPLYSDTGARVKITNIATAAVQVYIVPAEAWAIGAYLFMRLVSIDTSTGANTNQGAERTLKVRVLS
jgi:hypothetical protein